jgi:hypothetical protein
MCFARLRQKTENGGGWFEDEANDMEEFYLDSMERVFTIDDATKAITECFMDTVDFLWNQYGQMIDWNAVLKHLKEMWFLACQASRECNFYKVNECLDKLEEFTTETARVCTNFSRQQVQGVYLF